MKKAIYLLLFAGCFICFSCGQKETTEESNQNPAIESGNSQAEEEAIAVAKTWLALIDSEQYKKSWDETAEIFQNAVPMENWGPAVENARLKFGKFISRELASATYTTTIPGGPDGEYVIIQFAAKFEKKEKAIETITPKKSEDGKWHVSGYYIK